MATVDEAVGTVDVLDMVDVVEPETATPVSVPTLKLTAILQMQAENSNAPRWEETMETRSSFVSCADS